MLNREKIALSILFFLFVVVIFLSIATIQVECNIRKKINNIKRINKLFKIKETYIYKNGYEEKLRQTIRKEFIEKYHNKELDDINNEKNYKEKIELYKRILKIKENCGECDEKNNE